MIEEKLNSLRPYVTGVRFVKNLSVIDLVLQSGWDIFESDTVTYGRKLFNFSSIIL